MSRATQLVQTRCGVPSWNLGGSSMRPALQDAQKMAPHRRQWCRVRRSDLRTRIHLSAASFEDLSMSTDSLELSAHP